MSVVRYGLGCEPAGKPIMWGDVEIGRTPEPKHDCEGGHTNPGLLGGWMCPCYCHSRPTPSALWKQAHDDHPDDMDRLRARYRELMIEHGHLIPAEPGTDHNLPCGWPGAAP